MLEPGAREALFALHGSGRAVGFLSNNSRATGEDLRRRLHGHGIGIAEHVVTPLEIIGAFIAALAGALASGFLLPQPGIPAENPPGAAEAVWAIPGAMAALIASYLYGSRRDRARGIVRA